MSSSDTLVLRSKLMKKGMIVLNPDRIITSQYFDTKDLETFRQSEEGILPRKKIRVRWYNDDMQKLIFEEKTSSIEGRFKTSSKIKKNAFDKMLTSGFFHKIYGEIKPSVKINYCRSYFELKKIRITFDSTEINSPTNSLRSLLLPLSKMLTKSNALVSTSFWTISHISNQKQLSL